MADADLIIRIVSSAAVVILGLFGRYIFRRHALKAIPRTGAGKKLLISRLINAGTWIVIILTLIAIWGGSIENIWVAVAGFLGIVAIGFFAVWSILSNILCGVIILLVKKIELNDKIEIVGEDVKGHLKDVTAFYCVITDRRGEVLIPNNQMIQKIIRKVK